MGHTSAVDAVDRQIIHCLQVDGRVSFAAVSNVVGISEQTVARRYRSLRDSGALRVVVLPEPSAAGQTSWFVRIRCRPGACDRLADTIAARADVSWMSVTSGGGELICVAKTDHRDTDGSVLRRLPLTSEVLTFTAYSILHTFVGGDFGWMALPDPLSPAQRRALHTRLPVRAGKERGIRVEDAPLLAGLEADGRASIAALARLTGWPQAKVAARLEELLATGSAYVDVDVSPTMFGFHAIAYLWLTVTPGEIDATGDALSRHPQTSFAAAITGSANLLAAVTCRDSDDLYTYVTTRVGALSAVTQVEIVPTLRRVKQAGTLVRDGRLQGASRSR